MRKGKRRDDAQREAEMARAVRMKNMSRYFERFSVYMRPWLRELTYNYKSRGIFPPMAITTLTSYYDADCDKEIAALLSLLVKENGKMQKCCRDIRLMVGVRPFEWFRNRGFVSISTGALQNNRTGGVANWEIARMMGVLWDSRRRTGNYDFDALLELGVSDERIRLLRLVLGTSDGLGMGLVDIPHGEIRCPFTRDTNRLLRRFFPDWRFYGSKDEAVKLFGLDNDFDFFYSALAYNELEQRNPSGCSRLLTLYQKRYNEGNFLEPTYWTGRRGILPKLE